MAGFIDSHIHLQDPRLRPFLPEILAGMPRRGITMAVVNGTCELDWPDVASLSQEHSLIIPSFGLHPWQVAHRSDNWQECLEGFLELFPNAGVGEIGLDRWIENPDFAAQTDVFKRQLALAAEGNRPATIHCLKAWGALWDILRTAHLPERGFLLHAYGDPKEMVNGFVDRGAYFSFSTYFLHEKKRPQCEVFRSIPLERILVETDAPAMAPPATHWLERFPAGDASDLNHPFNLLAAYRRLADVLDIPVEELAAQVAQNFRRLFQ